jgi:hypothetical protein
MVRNAEGVSRTKTDGLSQPFAFETPLTQLVRVKGSLPLL